MTSSYGAMGPMIDSSWWIHFSFQPVLHDRPWYVLSCMWDGAYKRSLLLIRKRVAHVIAAAGFLSLAI